MQFERKRKLRSVNFIAMASEILSLFLLQISRFIINLEKDEIIPILRYRDNFLIIDMRQFLSFLRPLFILF